MARSKREQYLIIGVASAVGIFALDRFALTPYTTARTAIEADWQIAEAKSAEIDTLFKKERQMRRAWADMRAVGLEDAPSEAERKLLHSIQSWAQQAGVANVSLRPERSNQDQAFVRVTVHVTGSGPTAAMAKLLWALETANVPVKVETMQLTPAKPGQDDLQLQLTASRLCAVDPQQIKRPGARDAVAAAPTREGR